ncbi:MAG: hypothetical protein BWY07_01469 [Candidatus Hydrogenedentes bacterium ADurb.Bin170]|nr:MAG: hypothetical protein BWY07_01469 [Candidatus Hydrogenedentes bacterium ADurb.Bin170]
MLLQRFKINPGPVMPALQIADRAQTTEVVVPRLIFAEQHQMIACLFGAFSAFALA